MVVTVITHKTKPWSQVLHHWQVRLMMGFLMGNARIKLDPRYPYQAVVTHDRALEEGDIEHAFRNSPDEMGHLRLNIFLDCPENFKDSELFDAIANALELNPVS